MTDLASIQHAVEVACDDLQDPNKRQAAESTLLQLRTAPNAVPICRHILQHSTSLAARFQAATAIREAAVRQWPLLSAEEQVALRQFLLELVLGLANDTSVLTRALVSALASVVKRGWQQQGWHASFFAELHTAASASPLLAAPQLRVLESLALEFAPDTASTMGMPWDFHEKCKASLQDQYLLQCFQHALHQATAANQHAPPNHPLLLAALSCINAILSWDFRGPSQGGRWGSQRFRGGNDSLHVRPGHAWRDVLVSDAPLVLLESLIPLLHNDGNGGGSGGGSGGGFTGGGGHHVQHHQNHTPTLPLHTPINSSSSTTPLAAAARQMLVHLCGLDGEVFPTENSAARGALLGCDPTTTPQGGTIREHYLARLLPLVFMLGGGSNPDAAVRAVTEGDERTTAQLLDCCRCVNAAAAAHSIRAFAMVQVVVVVPSGAGHGGMGAGHGGGAEGHGGTRTPSGAVLNEPGNDQSMVNGQESMGGVAWLTALTCAVLGARFDPRCTDADELHTMAELLLEAWVALLEPQNHVAMQQHTHTHPTPPSPLPNVLPEAAQGCCAVFHALLAAGLQAAAAGAHLDGDDDGPGGPGEARAEDWMSRMAALGRLVPEYALQMLHTQLQAQQQALVHTAQAGGDLPVVLEQLCWLLQLVGFMLADPGHGETPLPPLPFMSLTSDSNLVVALSHSLLNTATMPLTPTLRPLISPTLMESALWAVARWGATYLCPEEPLPRVLEGAFGRPGKGPAIVERLLQAGLQCLTEYPAEGALHEVIATQLLPMLTRHKGICSLLVQPPGSPTWHALVTAAASHTLSSCGMPPDVHRALLQHVALAAQGLSDASHAHEYTTQLYQWPLSQLHALVSTPNLKTTLSTGNTSHRLEFILECLRGIASGALPSTQPAHQALLMQITQPLLTLQRAVAGNVLQTTLVFELAGDVLEAQQVQLGVEQAGVVVQWALQMMVEYGKHRGGEVSLQTKSSMQAAEAVEEVREELHAVLRVLTQVLQRDVASLDSDAAAYVAKATIQGLDHIVPVLTPQLLAAPSLAASFFSTLAYLTELFPDHVASLPASSFHRLISLLEYGLQHPDQDVLQQCLEAVGALAGWHVTMTGGGTMPDAGLGGHNAAGADGVTALGRLMHKCLERVLYDPTLDPLESLADALLPLILAERGTYQHIGTMLLANQQDPVMRSTLEQALHKLLVLDGTAGVDRQAKRRFRSNLIAFAGEARSVVCVR